MPNPIPASDQKLYKKGDRVQNIDSGIFGTVYQDQTDPLLVHLNWDKYPGQIECYQADAVRLAPWHEINLKDYVSDPDWQPLGFLIELNLPEDAVTPDPVQRLLDLWNSPNQSRFGGAVKIDPVHLRNFREAGLFDSEKLPEPESVPPKSGLAKELGRLAEDLEAAIMYGPNVLRNDAAAVASKLRALSENL